MQKFHSKIESSSFQEAGKAFAQCPSNIALIKYWGKREIQIPMNPSLSFTLNESKTETTLHYSPKESKNSNLNVFLDSEFKPDFAPKIQQFFDRVEAFLPFLKAFDFEIQTQNTFPHSSGIASSASGMGALALCLVQLENQLGGNLSESESLLKASFLARLGSGSACRSLYPGISVWGESSEIEGSSNEYAIPYPYEVHSCFQNYQDTILLIDEGQKEVSSTVGHNLMNQHPYAEQRFKSANDNLKRLIPVLKSGDLEEFGKIVEHEALSLHAMMMTSSPHYLLMRPNTLHAIEAIWEYRKDRKLPLSFTLDAGANIHLLYPSNIKNEAIDFINERLSSYCSNHKFIKDFTF